MMKSLLFAATAVAAIAAAPASAANFSFAGNLTDPSQVLLFNFSVGSASTVTLRTYSYAGGTNAAGQTFASGGFDPILALFDSNGVLINQNDDGGGNVPADPNTGSHYDTYLQSLLAPGAYTVSVMVYPNFANGPTLADGFRGASSYNGRTTAFAFDVLGADQAVGPGSGAVPEPATWAMMIMGFGLMGGALRSQRSKPKVSYAIN